jgi:uncharacterized membrane protein
MAAVIFYIIICLYLPYFFERGKAAKYLSPVVMCYVAGIIISFFPFFDFNPEIKQNFMGVAIFLAIPMVLLSTNMNEWINLSKEISKAFAITVISMASSIFLCSMFFIREEHIHYISAMLSGAYIGSAANMNAVGIALEVPNETFLLVNIADIASTGLFLIIITTFLYPLLNLFLKKYTFETPDKEEIESIKVRPKDYISSLVWTLGINITVLVFSFLFFKSIEQMFIIIMLSIISILLSKVKNKPVSEASFSFGYFLLLVFCVVIGSMVDISSLSISNLWIVGFGVLILFLAVIINIILAYFLKIHSELVLISLAASIYSVPFIGQIALSINKKEIITPGIICSLVGYAIGTFIGIGMSILVKWAANIL